VRARQVKSGFDMVKFCGAKLDRLSRCKMCRGQKRQYKQQPDPPQEIMGMKNRLAFNFVFVHFAAP
jgi:hypothetical protein